MRSDFDVVICGAGIAGSALAFSLGQAGRKVLLLERDLSVPDRIVGELLQPGGCAALRELGMGDCLDDIDAIGVEGYYISYNRNPVQIPYPPSQAGKGDGVGETPSGHVEGRSFVHGKFVDRLRKKASSSSNVTLLEATVKSLINCEDSSRVIGLRASLKLPSSSSSFPSTSSSPSTSKDISFFAPLTIIADGCFSRFRSPVSPAPITRSHFVGLVLQDAPLPMPRHGTVVLGDGNGPVLLYQIGTHETRMLVDIKGKLPSIGDGSLKRHIEDRIVPGLPEELVPSVMEALEASEREGGDKRLRVMPNSWLSARQQSVKGDREGCIVVGDAWNMRHPLTGGGMTVALHDCLHLTRILAPSDSLPSLDDWQTYAPDLQLWHWKRKNLASVVNVLSIALYDLFGADDPYLEVLRSGCFKYFQLGGTAVSGPVSLLSALAPKPLLLFYHFFFVAFYSIWCMFTHPQPSRASVSDVEKKGLKGDDQVWSRPSPLEYPALAVKSALVFKTACVVLLPVIWDEMR